MKLLILTQAVDLDDIFLGFFHGWLEEFAKNYEQINVICLWEGRHSLPDNVHVYSLGKEGGRSRLKYVYRFYKYLWTFRNEYDAVFVHMNQEYVLLGGIFWRLMGKGVYLWRNYHAGNVLTRIAIALCSGVFCTSRSSYTARFSKTTIMPVGVNTLLFGTPASHVRVRHSILSLGRISKDKNLDIFIEALGILAQRGIAYTAHVYGSALPKDVVFRKTLMARVQELGISAQVTFHDGPTSREGPAIFQSHDFFVNLSPSGMYDKTIFEAAFCGCLPFASSKDFAREVDARFVFPERDANALADCLQAACALSSNDLETARQEMRSLVESRHSLKELATRLRSTVH